MAQRTNSAAHSLPANDDASEELVDRLRKAAMGSKSSAKSMRKAQMAFDTSVDFEKRARILANFAAQEAPRRAPLNLKKSASWLPIPMGILLVMALGSALAKKVSRDDQSAVPVKNEPTPASTAITQEKHDPSKKAKSASPSVIQQ